MIYTELTVKAARLAYEAHNGQTDHSGLPYIFHPYHLAEQMDDEISVCAALLHDVVEDTEITLDDLKAQFPPEITDVVALLTHEEDIGYYDYVRRLRSNPVARKVKLADLDHNSDQSRLFGNCVSQEDMLYWQNKYSKARAILNESLSDRFPEREPVEKGWSQDKKYCVRDKDGRRYLLRISDISEREAKLDEFNMMKKVAALGVPMCQPIEFGTCEEGVFSLQSWIDGTDADVASSSLSDSQVYEYGFEAGRILKRIHSIPAPQSLESWEVRFNRKMDYKLKRYSECPIKYDGGKAFIKYINENRHLLKGRPQTYQHGDYHIGNMMIDCSGNLQIIDFNRNDYGDPWEEFNRIVWCAQTAPAFASGMVDGYFGAEIPTDFWRLLALYISSNALSSIYWAVPFGQKQIDVMLNQGKEILDWYDNMRNPVPSWYCSK